MAGLDVITDAVVPPNTSLNIIIEEDANGEGTFETSATISVPDGTGTQTVSGFDGSVGNDVRITAQFSTSEVTVGASLNSVSVSPSLKPPTNVTTSVTDDDVTISWDAASGASEYDVLRAQSSGTTASDYSTIASVTDDGSASFSVTDTGLEDGERFFYRVESVS